VKGRGTPTFARHVGATADKEEHGEILKVSQSTEIQSMVATVPSRINPEGAEVE